MRLRKSIVLLATLAFVTAIPAVQAASVSLIPAASTVPVTAGTATLEPFMDFTGDPTVGGGID
ncbi:MAG: hypothetical protein ACE5G3_09825, partial [Gammaproteobacteria bacterium]